VTADCLSKTERDTLDRPKDFRVPVGRIVLGKYSLTGVACSRDQGLSQSILSFGYQSLCPVYRKVVHSSETEDVGDC
jgi:hypothetical protein